VAADVVDRNETVIEVRTSMTGGTGTGIGDVVESI
jgi:hypothetical protein